jgi:hypothetical protein
MRQPKSRRAFVVGWCSSGLSRGFGLNGFTFAMRFLASLLSGLLLISAASAGAAQAAVSHTASSASVKPANVAFGAGPANTKKIDGRPYFAYDSSAGGSFVDHIGIINFATHKLTLNVYAVDATSGPNGIFSYAPKAAPRRQVGSWLEVGVPNGIGEVVVGPRATVILPVFPHVPGNASPGDHVGAVIVSITGLAKNKRGQQIKIEQRIATRVIIRVSGLLQPRLTIENLQASYSGSLNPFAGGAVTVSYTVANTGNVLLGAAEQVSVQGLFGSTARAPRVPGVPLLLPGGSYRVRVQVTGVFPEISLSATARLVPEGLRGDVNPSLHITTASVTVLAIPWSLIVIIVVVALAVIGVLWRRRRRMFMPALRARTAPEGVTS